MTRSACILLFVFCATLAAEPRLFYSKFFKGSVPEFVAINLDRNGRATYQEAKDDDNPLQIQLPQADTQEIFSLVEKLDRFQRPLESGLKIANLGEKTFRFEDGAERHEIHFNYSQDANAQALLDWFERIAESERHFINLERTVRYDKLGINDVLLQLQITYDKKRLVAPEQFLSLLDRVAKNESFLHIARERAGGLAESIRKPSAPSPEKAQP